MHKSHVTLQFAPLIVFHESILRSQWEFSWSEVLLWKKSIWWERRPLENYNFNTFLNVIMYGLSITCQLDEDRSYLAIPLDSFISTICKFPIGRPTVCVFNTSPVTYIYMLYMELCNDNIYTSLHIYIIIYICIMKLLLF